MIMEGDPIYVRKCDPKELSIGDIITFRKDDIYVTHRVLWVLRKGDTIRFITKGDNEITLDPPASPGQILGKVVDLGRADHIIHLERPFWRFINRFFGVIFLMEAVSILLYRFTADKYIPFRIFLHATFKPSDRYRHFKNRGLSLAMRIIT